jgi:hypothetical protein
MNLRIKWLLGVVCLLALAGCGGPQPGATGGNATPLPTANPAVLPTQSAKAGYPAPAQPTTPPVAPAQSTAAGYPAPAKPAAPVSGTPNDPAVAGAMAALAQKDLAQRLSVSVDQITVVSNDSTDWGDASLGCPQPNMAYAQVITPGFHILLKQAGKLYDYRTDLGSQVVLCANP